MWPRWAFYPPVFLYNFWLGLRYGGLTTFTAANPSMVTGGFVGDKKSDIQALFPEALKKYLPQTWVIEPDTKSVPGDLPFPIIAKPNMGCRGAGVQKIYDFPSLEKYIEKYALSS